MSNQPFNNDPAQPQNETQNHSQHRAWDHDVDWLVAGAGAGGMTGAIVAGSLGVPNHRFSAFKKQ